MKVTKEQSDRIDRLCKSSISRSEANRIVLGWSEPDMATFWSDCLEKRPKDSPPLTQKELFFLALKTSFGADYSESKILYLEKTAFDEICWVIVRGIKLGHIKKRSLKNESLADEKLFSDARSEFQRLLQEDPRFKRVKRREE